MYPGYMCTHDATPSPSGSVLCPSPSLRLGPSRRRRHRRRRRRRRRRFLPVQRHDLHKQNQELWIHTDALQSHGTEKRGMDWRLTIIGLEKLDF